MDWRDELEINTKNWDETCKYFPAGSSLFNTITTKLLDHINRRDDISKKQEKEKLKRKLSKFSDNFRSVLTEVFWFSHLYDNNWVVTIEPDYPKQGPDCLGRIYSYEFYFEVISIANIWETPTGKKDATLLSELNRLNLSGNLFGEILSYDSEFDKKRRSEFIKEIKKIAKNFYQNEKFYIICSEIQGTLQLSIIKKENVDEDELEGKYIISLSPFDTQGNIMFSSSSGFRPAEHFLKQVTPRIEEKLKKQIKPSRENYVVIDVPLSYDSSVHDSFENVIRNVKRYRERLKRVYGIFLIWRDEMRPDISYQIIKFEPNPKCSSQNSKLLRKLCIAATIKDKWE